jgi:DNA polymerase III delta prime subunit
MITPELIEDKYNPKKIDELISPNPVIESLKKYIQKDDMNLLFIGSMNTFKLSAMKLVLNEYYQENYKDYVLMIDCFSDITYSGTINELKTFCKSNSKRRKCVFIDNFDIINEPNQQYFKKLMDTSPNVFFLFGCENTAKINEIIQTRMHPIFFQDLTKTEYKKIIETIMEKEEIRILNYEKLLDYSHINIYYLFNLFNKFSILDLKVIEDIEPYVVLLDNKLLDSYFKLVHNEEIKEATFKLFELYEKGYSLLDIYHFIYEYLKNNSSMRGISYLYIEKICYYINHIYEGFDNKLMLLFFTNELFTLYKNRDTYIYGA